MGRQRRRTTSVCAVCGITFEHLISRDAKYCSKACWSKRKPPVKHICDICGVVFMQYKYRKQRFCGLACRDVFLSDLMSGDGSPFWRGGKMRERNEVRKLPEYKQWRKAVFARDDWTCQECGIKNVYLHAHHVFSFADFPELRLEVWNGVTLCEACHQLAHPDINSKFSEKRLSEVQMGFF